MIHDANSLYAHIHAARGGGFILTITKGTVALNEAREDNIAMRVNGKREARRIAQERNALPWNF